MGEVFPVNKTARRSQLWLQWAVPLCIHAFAVFLSALMPFTTASTSSNFCSVGQGIFSIIFWACSAWKRASVFCSSSLPCCVLGWIRNTSMSVPPFCGLVQSMLRGLYFIPHGLWLRFFRNASILSGPLLIGLMDDYLGS